MEVFSIENRRYLGSKQQLLNFIEEIINKNTKNCKIFADIFAGTAVVANHFKNRYDLVVNDTLMCNYYSYVCFFSNLSYSKDKIKKIIKKYNNLKNLKPNYYSENFANTYLSTENLKKLGFIRDDIDKKFANKEINKIEFSILLTSLIYAVDKIANTVGHYDAYRKNGELDKKLILKMPLISNSVAENKIFNTDANKLAKNIKSDIVYLDPPYNSRQYCDAYHFLENIALNQKPKVSGIAKKMDRKWLKSKYCLSNAKKSLKKLIDDLDTKYILLSYNNTNSANPRSNTKISDDDILKILQKKGEVSTFEKDFTPFSAGKSNIKNHKERIFFCKVNDKFTSLNIKTQKKVIQSPLNYTGGKFKILSQISSKFPKNINTFYDIFCGGFNVGANIKAKNIVGIDKNAKLIELLNFIKNESNLESKIDKIIKKFSLSNSFKNGYEFYKTNSSKGLGSFNKDNFIKLREFYNSCKEPLLLLVLTIFSFNNQIRFNLKGDYNLPVGKRDFNVKLRNKLKQFIINIQGCKFICKDYKNIDIDIFNKDDFIYLDPPYLLGMATYNENGGWSEKNEIELLQFLTHINEKNIKFALSNVMEHKEKRNEILLDWCLKNSFNIHHITKNYKNSNYQSKHKNSKSKEVLITNY